MIKVLVADDSALMRKLLEGIFREQGDFEVRTARNGDEALALAHDFDPHVVTLDVQMPGMDGLTCLGRIMIESPRPVVMISSLTEAGAEATLEAMELGAIDFIAKPDGAISLEIDRLTPIIIEKVRAAAAVRISGALRLRERIRHTTRRMTAERTLSKRSKRRAGGSPGLILIGTSTGGPAALDMVLPALPDDLPWPVLVAQHMPGNFTGPFAKRLDRHCPLNVVEVAKPTPLLPGTIHIGRGDADVILSRRAAGIVAMPAPAQPDYPWHPSVERMVSSALEHYAADRLIGVLMTGMGNDGAKAMSRLRGQGGHTIAEAESTAVVWGMPGELVAAGGAEAVMPVDQIAKAIVEMVKADATH